MAYPRIKLYSFLQLIENSTGLPGSLLAIFSHLDEGCGNKSFRVGLRAEQFLVTGTQSQFVNHTSSGLLSALSSTWHLPSPARYPPHHLCIYGRGKTKDSGIHEDHESHTPGNVAYRFLRHRVPVMNSKCHHSITWLSSPPPSIFQFPCIRPTFSSCRPRVTYPIPGVSG